MTIVYNNFIIRKVTIKNFGVLFSFMKRLHTAFLRPGMVTGEDVFSLYDQLLIAKDTVLTDAMISIMAAHGVVNVLVKERSPKGMVEDTTQTYSQRIKDSVEFKQFKTLYENEVEDLKSRLNLLVSTNDDMDVEYFYRAITRLLERTSSGMGVFDLLQNMREYDDSVFTHSVSVSMICNIFAQWLGFSQREIETATISGLLHDVGKIQIPESILKKPGKLTKEEYDLVKKHTVTGYQFLKDRKVDIAICNAALMHHERYDGTGYPLKLSFDGITKYAKLVAIADVFDAMTAARVYRGPLCPFTVIDLFEQEGLQKYDPAYILPFLENVVVTYISFSCLLSDGRTGTIVYINKHKLSRPMIQCEGKYIDLSTTPDLHIVSLI